VEQEDCPGRYFAQADPLIRQIVEDLFTEPAI
jgi:hypothetical protein